MVIESITIALGLIGQFNKLAENPNVKPAITGLKDWVGNMFTKSSAKENLEKVQEDMADEATVKKLERDLEYEMDDNEEKAKELQALVDEVQRIAVSEGLIQEIGKQNIKIKGSKNVVQSNIQTGGDFNINIS